MLNRKSITTLLFLVTIVTPTAMSQTADWSQWRGPNRDGKTNVASLPKSWPKALKEQWKMDVGVGHASPVLADGKIYVFARQAEEEVLLCLDAATGKQLWRSANPVS